MKEQIFSAEEIKALPAIINYLEPKKIDTDNKQLKDKVFPVWNSKFNSNTYALGSHKPISKMLAAENHEI